MITGLNHSTLAVSELRRSFKFYHEVLGLKPLARWESGAYFLAGDFWICLSLDRQTRKAPLPEYTHLAFTISESDFDAACARIEKSGATIWKENKSEGASLYFLDPDGHKLEIHVSDWRCRIESWRSDPWKELEIFI